MIKNCLTCKWYTPEGEFPNGKCRSCVSSSEHNPSNYVPIEINEQDVHIMIGNILPLIKYNDIRIVCKECEICLLREGKTDTLSEKYLNTKISCITCEDDLPNTINIYIEEE